MPTYVCLVNYTDEGIKNVGDTVARTDRGGDIAHKHGVKLEQAYWTVCPYDMVVIFEASDDQAISAHLLEVASSVGIVKTVTLRTFDREAMGGIIERLGS